MFEEFEYKFKEKPYKIVAKEMLESFLYKTKEIDTCDYYEEILRSKTIDIKTRKTEEPIPVVATPDDSEVVGLPKPEVEEIRVEETGGVLKGDPVRTEKGDYESVVTNNYFEGWDQLVLNGNPEIKDQIRQNIIRAEKMRHKVYQETADRLGISIEEFKARLQAKIEEMVRQSNFFRATNFDVLEMVMGVDGRWKSQFETGRSNGRLDPQYRARQEMAMFGFNRIDGGDGFSGDYGEYLSSRVLETSREKRPIYGYFSDDEHGGINRYDGKIPPPTIVSQYGQINFKIKRERALEKATITFHDSLGVGSGWPPTPAARPHFTSFNLDYIHSYPDNVLTHLSRSSIVNWGQSYTEVQYHGQLTMDDVESIHVSTHNGLSQEDVQEVRRIFNEYKKQHPESTIQLIEF